MSEEAAYVPIPVAVAREIAARYQKSQVVILAWDPVHELTHTTTYGVEPDEKERAAEVGDACAKAICGDGFERRRSFEDYRHIDAGERAKKIDQLYWACKSADHAIASVMAERYGITDLALQAVRDALSEAMTGSGVVSRSGSA